MLLPAWIAALAGGGALRLYLFSRDTQRARAYAANAVPFERPLDGDGPALLVAGDSLSVGVGAEVPAHSVAGRMAAACPGLSVVNRARSGARLADVPAQLAGASRTRWDAVLLTIGGNDALGVASRRSLREDAARSLACAREIAPRVVVASSANLGAVPIFPWPLTRILEARTRTVRDVLRDACEAQRVEFVDFFRPLAVDPFVRDPELWFGPDGVHPSSACYALCFAVIERRTGLAAMLARKKNAPRERGETSRPN